MLKQHKNLEEKIHQRIYRVMMILEENDDDFKYLDTSYLSGACLQNFFVEGDLICTHFEWKDPYDDYDWSESYKFPVKFIEDDNITDEEVLAYWKGEDDKLKLQHDREIIRELVCCIGGNISLAEETLLEFKANKDFTSKDYLGLVEKLSK